MSLDVLQFSACFMTSRIMGSGGTVGASSCNGQEACRAKPNFHKDAGIIIGDNSCNGYRGESKIVFLNFLYMFHDLTSCRSFFSLLHL